MTTISVTSAPLPVAERAGAVSRERNTALDWTKGALILCMVAYHSLSYSAFRPLGFRYLSFLPPSFILITGFLVTQVYAARYDLATGRAYRRLASRGLKLLLLFVALNVANCILVEKNVIDGLLEFAYRAPVIFGSGNGRTGIFEVLLPIAYFLLLSPLLLWSHSRSLLPVPIIAISIFIFSTGLELSGIYSKNLTLLGAGFVGAALGLVSLRRVESFCKRFSLVLGIYLVYRVVSYRFGDPYPVQMIAAVVTLALVYSCALKTNGNAFFAKAMASLGHYSLFAYLAQILLLQVVIRLLGGRPTHWSGVLVSALSTTLLLIVTVWICHRLRRASKFADSAYKAVFA